jgi:hypothetical protein
MYVVVSNNKISGKIWYDLCKKGSTRCQKFSEIEINQHFGKTPATQISIKEDIFPYTSQLIKHIVGPASHIQQIKFQCFGCSIRSMQGMVLGAALEGGSSP